jgi:hypothetical protein
MDIQSRGAFGEVGYNVGVKKNYYCIFLMNALLFRNLFSRLAGK